MQDNETKRDNQPRYGTHPEGKPMTEHHRGRSSRPASGRGGHDNEVYEITSADTSLTEDQSGRIRRYTIQMTIRTVCFIGAVLADGWLRWVLFIAAMVLPYFAVVLANNTRQIGSTTVEDQQALPQPEPSPGSSSSSSAQRSALYGQLMPSEEPDASEETDASPGAPQNQHADPLADDPGRNRADRADRVDRADQGTS